LPYKKNIVKSKEVKTRWCNSIQIWQNLLTKAKAQKRAVLAVMIMMTMMMKGWVAPLLGPLELNSITGSAIQVLPLLTDQTEQMPPIFHLSMETDAGSKMLCSLDCQVMSKVQN
jgi:hypothetical protein